KHPKGALLKLPFFTTDMKKKFFANLWLTFHSWSLFSKLFHAYQNIEMPGSKGLSPHELAHRWVKDLRTRPAMSIKVG
ncbi:hypothetical protein, partial [[Ruminococcus] torques]|uniref:hypothetical protein n=6 Tax=[Ruminococcus] torques TaxID=33039 RepID=UPI001A9A5892